MKSPKELFDQAENGVLTYDEFEAASKAAGVKWTDLSEGGYVSKHKYDDDLKARDSQIETLNATIGTRDTDLESLKQQLANAGADADKLTALNQSLTDLQNKYDADTKQYQEKLSKQAYEFAVKEFAATKKFSSNAAKRDFTQSMIAENLKFKDGKIIGADDFVNSYTEENADAFLSEREEDYDNSDDEDYGSDAELPKFVGSASGGEPSPVDSNAFAEAFHFTGIRGSSK